LLRIIYGKELKLEEWTEPTSSYVYLIVWVIVELQKSHHLPRLENIDKATQMTWNSGILTPMQLLKVWNDQLLPYLAMIEEVYKQR
tara:strand:- start:7897 stop:8154 length:258 start_codon:yes stop_codon:yes gene_type:complete